jgi:hypothetical protein
MVMKKIFIILQFLISFGYVYPTPLDVLPTEIKNFLDDYRNIKSRRFVTTGHRLVDYYSPETAEIDKKYFHEMYFGIGESGDEVIYIYIIKWIFCFIRRFCRK